MLIIENGKYITNKLCNGDKRSRYFHDFELFFRKDYSVFFAILGKQVSLLCGDKELKNIYEENKSAFLNLLEQDKYFIEWFDSRHSNVALFHTGRGIGEDAALRSFNTALGIYRMSNAFPVKYKINGRVYYYRDFFEELGL